jgi:hypothetical protein
MALEDLVSVELTPAEIDEVTTSLTKVLDIIKPKAKNLTPSERQMYGRVRYEFEVWIDKCRSHMHDNPTLVPPYIDTAEYEKDYAARVAMKPIEAKLQQLYEMFDDTFVLLGHDLFTNSIAFYNAVKTAAKNNVPGSTTIYQDLKQQFPGGGKKTVTPATPPTP